MQDIKISIIVPVYNVEKYLRECLDSLIRQSHQNIEIICINDGSTDNSLAILEEYKDKDERIIVINQEHSGVSCARNKGMDIARGDYLMFCDGDDYYLADDGCEKALEKILKEDSDICVFGSKNIYEGELFEGYVSKYIRLMLAGQKELEYEAFVTVWQKIWKREFIEKNNLRLYEKVNLSEDFLFMWNALFCNPKYSMLDKNIYAYRRNREDSLTTAKTSIKTMQDEYLGLKYLYNLSNYTIQSENIKKSLARKYLGKSIFNYYKYNSYFAHWHLRKNMINMVAFLEKNHSKEFLTDIEEYNKIKEMIRKIPFEFHLFFWVEKKFSQNFSIYLEEINFGKTLKKYNKTFKNKKIILYGAGDFFEYLNGKYSLDKLNILGISDMKFSKTQERADFLGYKIIPREELFNQNADIILVATPSYAKIINILQNENKNKKMQILPLAPISFVCKYQIPLINFLKRYFNGK